MGKPMVVVLEGGSIIKMPWLANVPAVVMAWYPGQMGGRALGKLLFGDENNWGKLPLSWAATDADLPEFASFSGTTVMPYAIGYRWYDENTSRQLLRTAPTARPMGFGYGLSYSKFSYGNLQVPCSDVSEDRRRQRHRRRHQHQRARGRRDRVPVRVVRAHHVAAPAGTRS